VDYAQVHQAREKKTLKLIYTNHKQIETMRKFEIAAIEQGTAVSIKNVTIKQIFSEDLELFYSLQEQEEQLLQIPKNAYFTYKCFRSGDTIVTVFRKN
jgi:CRISPR/Cas system endoribonuclease Cas6 (RAMP superfamily)